MNAVKYSLLLGLCLLLRPLFGQGEACSMNAGVNKGVMAQFNNGGDVYLTLIVFDIGKDQLIIDIAKNLKAASNEQAQTAFADKKFTTLQPKSPAQTQALQQAKEVILPKLAAAKATVCFEDVINDAQKAGKLQVQQADAQTTRLIIGDAERALSDFKVVFENPNVLEPNRIRENGKYYFINRNSEDCLVQVLGNCKRFDFAADFVYGTALVGEKQFGGQMEYYFINQYGATKTPEFRYKNVVPNFFGNFIKLQLLNGQEVLADAEGKHISELYDRIDTFRTSLTIHSYIPYKKSARVYRNNRAALIWYNDNQRTTNYFLGFRFEDIGELFPIWNGYNEVVYINVQDGGFWNMIYHDENFRYFDSITSIKLLFNKKQEFPIKLSREGATALGASNDYLLAESGSKFGLLRHDGQVICEIQFDEIGKFEKGLAKVRIGKQFGLINIQGVLILPVQYDAIEAADAFGNCRLRQGKFYGLFNTAQQKTITEARFTEIQFLSDIGYKQTDADGRSQLLDAKGIPLVKGKYRRFSELIDERFFIAETEKGKCVLEFISKPETAILQRTEPAYDSIVYLGRGGFWLKNEKSWGILPPAGAVVDMTGLKYFQNENLIGKYAHIGELIKFEFRPDIGVVLLSLFGNLNAVVNYKGSVLLNEFAKRGLYQAYYIFPSKIKGYYTLDAGSYPHNFFIILHDGERIGWVYKSVEEITLHPELKPGAFLIKTEQGRQGILMCNSNFAVPPIYQNIDISLSTGYFFARDSTLQSGFIDHRGLAVSGFKYESYKAPTEGLILVKVTGGGFGYTAIQGGKFLEVISCKYAQAEPFKGGYAIVSESNYNNFGLINSQDEPLIPLIFDLVSREGTFFSVKKGTNIFKLRKSARANVKRLECFEGDCDLYEQLARAWYERRN